MFSIITTEPSTMSPKSIAPRLIRLPDTPIQFMPMNATSIESGITEATIKLARRSPRNRKSTTVTSMAPSARLWVTVSMVRRIRSARS